MSDCLSRSVSLSASLNLSLTLYFEFVAGYSSINRTRDSVRSHTSRSTNNSRSVSDVECFGTANGTLTVTQESDLRWTD